MLTNVLFYVVLVSALTLIFVGNRVTEGGKREFGRKGVKKVLGKLKKIFPGANPKFVLSTLLAAVTLVMFVLLNNSVVDFGPFNHYNGFQLAVIVVGYIAIMSTMAFALTYVYYFCERLAEIFTYYWRKIWLLDLTKKSRVMAILFMVAMAAGLVDAEEFGKIIEQLGERDTTIVWIRKIKKERREYEKRRNGNQEELRESRMKWDLRNCI